MSDDADAKEITAALATVSILFVVLFAISLLLGSWILMLLLGAMHTIFPVIPALGFWPTVIVVLFLNTLAGIIGFKR